VTPRVSIVLPTRNGAIHLDEAVRSVAEQTFRDWELVLVDDASTDETPRIIARWAARDERIRPLRNERNLRLPGALNAGFAAASGEYLTWTSDDNLYLPEAIARMTAFLDGNPGVDVVYADYVRIDRQGRVTGSTRVGRSEEIYFGNCIGPCFLYRREVGRRLGGYREDLYLAEDMDFWLRAAAAFNLSPLREALYAYREHDGSLTSRHAPKVIRATERALKGFFAAHPFPDGDVRARSWLAMTARAIHAGERRLADKYFVYAACSSPSRTFRDAGGLFALRGELDEARLLLMARERELEAIRGTWSWKVTAPLRELKRILSRRKAGEP
jgi:glycosyltransferase involved in cell wall biosynthesis